MCDFQVGEEIICIDDEIGVLDDIEKKYLIKGQTYIVQMLYVAYHEVYVNVGASPEEKIALAGGCDEFDEAGWIWTRFRRPIVDEIDITDKAALLKEAMVKAR